jgi:hypothetical protein
VKQSSSPNVRQEAETEGKGQRTKFIFPGHTLSDYFLQLGSSLLFYNLPIMPSNYETIEVRALRIYSLPEAHHMETKLPIHEPTVVSSY